MDRLTLLQIEKISQEVKREDITYSHLLYDLIDHICCDVEYEMDQGLAFHDAYTLVKDKIGLNGLRKIQSETLYAVDSKYRTMKRTMKISGIAGTILLGFAALFKIIHWPGAGIMLVVGAFILAAVFLPSSLSVLYKESKSTKRILLFVSAFLAAFFFILGAIFKVQHWPLAGVMIVLAAFFAIVFLPQLLASRLAVQTGTGHRSVLIMGFASAVIYLLGLVFKFQHWPGAGILMLSGSLLLFGFCFSWWAWLNWKDTDHIHTTFIFLVPTIIWVIAASGLINLRVSYNYYEGYQGEYEKLEAVNAYLQAENGKLLALPADTSVQAKVRLIYEKSNELINQVTDLKRRMILASPVGAKDDKTMDMLLQHTAAAYMDIQSKPSSLMFGNSPDRQKLEQSVAAFRDFAARQGNLSPAASAGTLKLLDPATCLPDPSKPDYMSLGSCMGQLSMLQNSVLTTEMILLRSLKEKPSTTPKTDKP